MIIEKLTWIPVLDYSGHYEISNTGKIKSLKSGKVKPIKPTLAPVGYYFVHLSKNGKIKRFSVHRLVLLSFVGRPEKGYQAAHLDGNKINNNLSNLKWCTAKENSSHKIYHGTHLFGESLGMSRFSESDIIKIRKLYYTGKYSQRELAKKFDTWQGVIGGIVRGDTWKRTKLYGLPNKKPTPSGDRNGNSKITEKIASKILKESKKGKSNRYLSDHFNVPIRIVRNITSRRGWIHLS